MFKFARVVSNLLAIGLVAVLACVAAGAGEPAAPIASPSNDFQPPTLSAGSKVFLEFPSEVRRAVGNSVLVFQAVVQKDGTIGVVQLLNDDRPYPGVEEAARRALRRVRYQPATVGGKPVDGSVTIGVMLRGTSAQAVSKPLAGWFAIPGKEMAAFARAVSPGRPPQQPQPTEFGEPVEKVRIPHCEYGEGVGCLYNKADFAMPSTLEKMPSPPPDAPAKTPPRLSR